LFLATEDWFFRSHFLPLAHRALADGFQVSVAARNSGALSVAELGGARLIDTPMGRGSLRLGHVWRGVADVRALLAREQPDIVHCIALRPIMLALLAGLGSARAVLAVTGAGFVGAESALWTWALSGTQQRMIRGAVARGRAILAVENAANRAWIEGGRLLPDWIGSAFFSRPTKPCDTALLRFTMPARTSKRSISSKSSKPRETCRFASM
jgi:hypothetical protein